MKDKDIPQMRQDLAEREAENLNEGESVYLHLDPEHTLAVTP